MHLWPWLCHKRIFGVFRAQGTCLVAANVVLFLSNKNLKLEANVVVYERIVCYRVVAYQILCDNFLHIFRGGVLTPETTH